MDEKFESFEVEARADVQAQNQTMTVTERELDDEIEKVNEQLMVTYREISQLVKLEADKYLYVSNATIQNTISQLPTSILNMKANEFMEKCTESEFDSKYNLEFKLFDEFNLLGLKKHSDTEQKAAS